MTTAVSDQKEARVVFTVGSKSFSVRDVIDAADFRGELSSHWEELLTRVAAERKAEGAGAKIDPSAIDAAAVAFRYQYDLITAEEAERWLELRAVTLADLTDYFVRAHWGQSLRATSTSPAPPFHEAPAELRELLAVELILSGDLEAMSRRLAWRVAAAEGGVIGAAATDAERQRFADRSGFGPGEISNWLENLGRDDAWFNQALAAEAAFRTECDRLLTPEAAEREIGSLRLPLTRFEVETIEFESRDAASEAVWCVQGDGMSMAEVAKESGSPYRRAEPLLEEIADDLQQKFLSLTPGSVLEPIPREGGFQLWRLLGKTEPKLSDPSVRTRIEQRILERHFADLTAQCIRWVITPVSTG